jgi:hypothetical protein
MLVGLTAAYPKYGCYSNAVARQAMLDHIPTTPAYEMVRKIRQVSDIPIFLAHQPLHREAEAEHEDGNLPMRSMESDGLASYRGIVGAINDGLFSGLRAKVLGQPAQTITKCFYTKSEYGIGAARLDLGDGEEEAEDDRAHMNIRFGDIYLSTHLRAIAYQ